MEGVGVQGHSVEVALDPRHAVEGSEELRCVHAALALLVGSAEEAREDDFGERVVGLDLGVGQLQQLRVAAR